MSRARFLDLAGQMYDLLAGGAAPAPSGGSGDGRAPKWDTTLPAGSGMVVYASECSLKELLYQQARSDKPPTDPKYAEANAKRSKALGYWITYRQTNPSERWQGERNKTPTTAAAPEDKPAKYPRVDSGAAPATPAPAPAFDDDDSDIPFILNVTSEPEERWNRFR